MKFIELTLGSHQILHGFDAQNKEIIEDVQVENPAKKLVAIDRILSLSAKYILISYAFDRVIYWEYEEPYETVRKQLEVLTFN